MFENTGMHSYWFAMGGSRWIMVKENRTGDGSGDFRASGFYTSKPIFNFGNSASKAIELI